MAKDTAEPQPSLGVPAGSGGLRSPAAGPTSSGGGKGCQRWCGAPPAPPAQTHRGQRVAQAVCHWGRLVAVAALGGGSVLLAFGFLLMEVQQLRITVGRGLGTGPCHHPQPHGHLLGPYAVPIAVSTSLIISITLRVPFPTSAAPRSSCTPYNSSHPCPIPVHSSPYRIPTSIPTPIPISISTHPSLHPHGHPIPSHPIPLPFPPPPHSHSHPTPPHSPHRCCSRTPSRLSTGQSPSTTQLYQQSCPTAAIRSLSETWSTKANPSTK